MEIEEQLKNLKKEYIFVKPQDMFERTSKSDLLASLGENSKTFFSAAPLKFALSAAFVLLFILTGTVAKAQSALPGETLYPVKILSENIVSAVSGKKQNTVEKRGQEIINLVNQNKDSANLKKAAEEYQNAIDKARKDKDQNHLEETLKSQERKFNQIIRNYPKFEDELKPVIEAAKKAQTENGDVKGEKENKSRSHQENSDKD